MLELPVTTGGDEMICALTVRKLDPSPLDAPAAAGDRLRAALAWRREEDRFEIGDRHRAA
jgi:hypothetical protein